MCKPAVYYNAPSELHKDCTARFKRWSKEKNGSATPPFKVILANLNQLTDVAGFSISRGALGSGMIPDRGEAWLKDYLKSDALKGRPVKMVALDQISDLANLGSIIRSSAAFGVDVIVLSKNSCDAWYRRSVRVSMGTIFKIPTIRVEGEHIYIYIYIYTIAADAHHLNFVSQCRLKR